MILVSWGKRRKIFPGDKLPFTSTWRQQATPRLLPLVDDVATIPLLIHLSIPFCVLMLIGLRKYTIKGGFCPPSKIPYFLPTFHFGLFSLSATTLQLLLRYRVFKKWFKWMKWGPFLTIYWFMKPQKCNWILWPFQIWDLGQLNQYTHDLLIWEPSLQTLPCKCWMLKLIYIGFFHIFTHFLRKNFTFFMITFFRNRKSLKRPVVNYEAE